MNSVRETFLNQIVLKSAVIDNNILFSFSLSQNLCFYYVVIFSHGKWATLIYLAVSSVPMHWLEEESALSARNPIYIWPILIQGGG